VGGVDPQRAHVDNLVNIWQTTHVSDDIRRTTTRPRSRAFPDRLLRGTDRQQPDLTVMPDEGRPLDLHAEFVPDAISRNRIFVDNLLVLL